MAMSSRAGRGVRNEINITPLVDVVLVLLIIFIVVTPLLRGVPVQLPAAQRYDPAPPNTPVSVSVTRAGQIYWEQDPIGIAELRRRLDTLGRDGSQRQVTLKADEALKVNTLEPILAALERARMSGVLLAVGQDEK